MSIEWSLAELRVARDFTMFKPYFRLGEVLHNTTLPLPAWSLHSMDKNACHTKQDKIPNVCLKFRSGCSKRNWNSCGKLRLSEKNSSQMPTFTSNLSVAKQKQPHNLSRDNIALHLEACSVLQCVSTTCAWGPPPEVSSQINEMQWNAMYHRKCNHDQPCRVWPHAKTSHPRFLFYPHLIAHGIIKPTYFHLEITLQPCLIHVGTYSMVTLTRKQWELLEAAVRWSQLKEKCRFFQQRYNK